MANAGSGQLPSVSLPLSGSSAPAAGLPAPVHQTPMSFAPATPMTHAQTAFGSPLGQMQQLPSLAAAIPGSVAQPAYSASPYTPGTLMGSYGVPGGAYAAMQPFPGGAMQPAPWIQSLQATVGGVGALAELVGMSAEAAKHFGAISLQLLETAGQTAGEVAGVMEPRPPLHPETGLPTCSPEEHLKMQRERAARWLAGAALVFGLVWMGRAATKHLSGGSGRGLRVILFVLAGATVGFTKPEWVESRAAAVASWVAELLDTVQATASVHQASEGNEAEASSEQVASDSSSNTLREPLAAAAFSGAGGTDTGSAGGDEDEPLLSREDVRRRRLRLHGVE